MPSTSRQRSKKTAGAIHESPLRIAYLPVREALDEVEKRLLGPEALESLAAFLGLGSGAGSFEEAERYIIAAGGKRLRAALTLLAARLCGASEDSSIPLAVGIELFHTASLVIDDMIVDAKKRRSMPTVHRKWDESGALAAALALQLRALPSFLESFRDAADPASLMALIGQTMTRVLWGAILQHRQRMNFDICEEEYIEIGDNKTAALFEACSEGGAVLAGCNLRKRAAMRRYGHHLGRAFQLTDDLLDFIGSPDALGKSPGSDLEEGRITMPMIHFFRKASPKRRAMMGSLLPPRRKAPLPHGEIVSLLYEEGSLDHCSKMAKAESVKARKALSIFPAGAERESMMIIASLASGREG